jgi:hypothetical protein
MEANIGNTAYLHLMVKCRFCPLHFVECRWPQDQERPTPVWKYKHSHEFCTWPDVLVLRSLRYANSFARQRSLKPRHQRCLGHAYRSFVNAEPFVVLPAQRLPEATSRSMNTGPMDSFRLTFFLVVCCAAKSSHLDSERVDSQNVFCWYRSWRSL